MDNILALDIGGTFIKYGLFSKKGEQKFTGKEATEKEPERFLKQLINIIKNIESTEEFEGVTLSIGGFIDPATGENTDFSVGKNFTTFNLKGELKKRTGYNISIENDANCAALAELWMGSGKGVKDFIMVTLGTGIGGAIVTEGRLLRGKSFKAGEFGLAYVLKNKSSEGESYEPATATGTLVKMVRKILDKEIDGEYIFNNLDNEIINKVYKEWINKISLLIGGLCICMDPEKLLIGGGVSSQSRLIEDIEKEALKIYPHLKGYTSIEACSLKNNAGMIGAVYNYINEYEEII